MHVFALILAFVSAAFAYEVTFPGTGNDWNNTGPQLLQWSRVNTDPLNFTVLLVNQNVTGFTTQNLHALVDGTLLSYSLLPPSGGWPTGPNFRVNLVKDSDSPNSILAQSGYFSILQPNGTSSSSSSTRSTPSTTSTGGDLPTTSSTDNGNPVPTGASSSGAIAAHFSNIWGILAITVLAYSIL